MPQDTQLIQRTNTEFGKTIHYNLENICDDINSMELTENDKYRLIIKKQNSLVTSRFSTSLSYGLRNFVLLKRLHHYFGKDINFKDFYKDFYEGTKNDLNYSFKGNGFDSEIYISKDNPYIPDDIIGLFFPHKKISNLGQKIIQLYNEKKEKTQTINKIYHNIKDAEEKFDSISGFEEKNQLEDCFYLYKASLKNIRIRNKLLKRQDSLGEKIEQTIKKLDKYFNYISHQRGLHITAESEKKSAYEIITNFYRQLLNPAREKDFDVAEARKEIEKGWGKTKQLAKEIKIK